MVKGHAMPDEAAYRGPEDADLVACAIAGDRDAFGMLVERYWRTAVAIAATVVRDPAQAEDVAQEAFVAAYRRLSSLRNPSRFAGWLATVVRQKGVDALRKAARPSPAPLAIVAEPAWLPSSNPGLTADEAETVRAAVRSLPRKFQEVVILRFVAGLSTNDIAERLAKRPSTVRVWLHRAYGRLRKSLAAMAPEV
jgi:RNA polymerase sigma-70 factor (ECF subfamily)